MCKVSRGGFLKRTKVSNASIIWISKFVLEMDRLTQERLRANAIREAKAA